jgi:site-specific DNA recombinase
MKPAKLSKAVIYCRVSSTKQVNEGSGLGSQETRCREYAAYKDYRVIEVFRDDISGGSAARPGMISMLNFLKKNRNEGCVVIIDDISRLARGLEAHLQLRTAISNAGGRLESPSIEFGEDSDSILVENLLASVSQHQRQKNGEQTKNRMRARAMGGYWPFRNPIGFRFERVAGHGKLLVRDEPHASILAEAIEGYAYGRFQILSEVKRFLESQPGWPKNNRGEVHVERVLELFNRPIYAGYISIPEWNLDLIPGKHQGLVSLATWKAMRDRLAGPAQVPARKNLHEDFPLRGFVTCGHCNQPMTACWSKGRSSYYGYYLCDTRGCVDHRKSVRKEKIEGEFEAILFDLKPSEGLFNLAFQMFRDLWDAKTENINDQSSTLQQDIHRIENQIQQFLDRILDASSASVMTAYEKRINELESQKALLAEKVASCGRPVASFGETYRTAFDFLANPWKLWRSDKLEDRRAVLKLVFAERLPYLRNEGYRTAKISIPFKTIGGAEMSKNDMVPYAGIEPALLSEPDFESGASTNSANRALACVVRAGVAELYEDTQSGQV